MGLGPDGITGCGEVNDVECPPQLTDGVGPNTVIDNNVIIGNTAESGVAAVSGCSTSTEPTCNAIPAIQRLVSSDGDQQRHRQ